MPKQITTNELRDELLKAILESRQLSDARIDKVETNLRDELMEVILDLRDAMIGQFNKIDNKFSEIDDKFIRLENQLRTEIRRSEANTRDFVDKRIYELRGDLISLLKKGDQRVVKMVDVFKNKKTLTAQEAKEIMSIEPVARFISS